MLLANAGRMRQIADASFFRRNGKDLAARRDRGPLAIGRDVEICNMTTRTHPMLHGLVSLPIHIDDQFFRLPRLQIKRVEVTAILKNNCIGAKARPHHVEFVELSKLFDLLAALVVTVEIEPMLGTAIGSEVNRVTVPHRKRVGVVRVRDDLIHDIVLNIVNLYVLRQTAGIALPLPEIAEDSVVSDFGAVPGERKQARSEEHTSEL